jgi:hypothetical protein
VSPLFLDAGDGFIFITSPEKFEAAYSFVRNCYETLTEGAWMKTVANSYGISARKGFFFDN